MASKLPKKMLLHLGKYNFCMCGIFFIKNKKERFLEGHHLILLALLDKLKKQEVSALTSVMSQISVYQKLLTCHQRESPLPLLFFFALD